MQQPSTLLQYLSLNSLYLSLAYYCINNPPPQAMDLLSWLMPGEEYDNPSHAPHKSPQHLERLYIFALMWSVGALLELDDRAKMEAFLAQQGGLDLPPVAATETMFECVVDEEGAWQHWSSRVQEYSCPTSAVPEYASILVPNVDNVRSTFLIHTVAKQNKAVLLIGEQGTAKTVTFKGHALRYDPEKHLFKAFNFSSASTPTLFQVGPWPHTLGRPHTLPHVITFFLSLAFGEKGLYVEQKLGVTSSVSLSLSHPAHD